MRKPGPLTGGTSLLTPEQVRKNRALAIMGLKLPEKIVKPLAPTFPIDDRGSANFQLTRARCALMFGWINQATYDEVEAIALPFVNGTPIQTTVDDVKLRADPMRIEPHPYEQKRKR